MRHPTLLAGLTMEREALYARIDARVEEMVAAGAREEVLRAHAAGASETARKALGFDELLAGDVEAMKRRTRNYARRQLTWMRKLAGVRDDRRDRARSADDVAAEIAYASDSRLQALELLLADRAARAQLVELVQLVDRRGAGDRADVLVRRLLHVLLLRRARARACRRRARSGRSAPL